MWPWSFSTNPTFLMKRILTSLCLLLSLGWSSAAELKVGDDAPDFSLQASDGKTYKLADFKGKQAVIIAWFPKAFTGGCTAECKSMRSSGAELRKFEVAYFTASVDAVDGPKGNKAFAESLELDYPILSDPEKKVAEAYGVVHEGRPVPERWTFVIGKDGKILDVDKAVKTGNHGGDLAAKMKALGVAEKK
jgi:peroxiredoxin Q/BCP